VHGVSFGAIGVLFEALIFFGWAYDRERDGKGVQVVLALWWVALLDTVFYADTDANKLNGFFHPAVFGQNVRLVQLLIPAAFAAHLAWKGWPRRWAVSAPWWWAFSLWTVYAIGSGLAQHHSGALIFRQASILIYVIMMLAMTAAVPVSDYLDEKRFTRFVTASALVGGGMLALTEAGVSHTTHAIPGLPLFQFGQLGPDAASLFPAIGVIGFLVELSRKRRRRPWFLVACGVLVLTHLASSQRAERVDLYLTIVLVLAACLLRARRRLRITPLMVGSTLVGALTLIVVVPLFVAGVQSAVTGQPTSVHIPLAQQTLTALNHNHRQGSVQSRYNQWGVVEGLIAQRPFLGYGLGDTFVHYEEGLQQNVTQDITHDIVLDLLYRNGIVGLVLFVGAIGTVFNAGILVWRRHAQPAVAALALAASAALAGLIARGLVESVFEKYRLAVGLGVLIGLVLSARTSLPDQATHVEATEGAPEERVSQSA
jgi:O-Antigen ligase